MSHISINDPFTEMNDPGVTMNGVHAQSSSAPKGRSPAASPERIIPVALPNPILDAAGL